MQGQATRHERKILLNVKNKIKKIVGREKNRPPLERLQALNDALKKLGCRISPEDNATEYRKIVGRR
jgi:exoribonuclease R